jgi:hypothetical protein
VAQHVVRRRAAQRAVRRCVAQLVVRRSAAQLVVRRSAAQLVARTSAEQAPCAGRGPREALDLLGLRARPALLLPYAVALLRMPPLRSKR